MHNSARQLVMATVFAVLGLSWHRSLAVAGTNDLPAIQAIEASALKNRRAIHSGCFRVQKVFDDGHKRGTSTVTTWLTADGRIRQDLNSSAGTYVLSFGNPWFITYQMNAGQFQLQDRTMWPVITMRSVTTVDRHTPPYSIDLLNPLLLMFDPGLYEYNHGHPLDRLVGAPGRESFRLRRSDVGGVEHVAVSFVFSRTGAAVTYDVVPTMGDSIVLLEVRSRSGKSSLVETNTCVPSEIAPGIWFPRTVDIHRVRDGQEVAHEQLSIEVSDVNGPIDASIFTLNSMNIPTDAAVRVRADGSERACIWDGSQLRDAKRADFTAIKLSRNSVPDAVLRRWPLWAAVACMLAGLACCVWYELRRRHVIHPQ